MFHIPVFIRSVFLFIDINLIDTNISRNDNLDLLYAYANLITGEL